MSPSYFCIPIDFATPEYDETVSLRYDILRKPLEMEFQTEDLATEFDSFHIACYQIATLQLVGCLILKPINTSTLKMRQVAVRRELQSVGIGSYMVKYSEVFAKNKGYHLMELHARSTAIEFYTKLGYQAVGKPFKEIGLPHIKMSRNL